MLMQGTIISRHLLKQIVMAITLLTVVLLFTAWLTQSLRFLEILANNAITTVKFLKVIVFLLPSLLVVILPVCCLIGTVSTIQKLLNENEIIIYQSLGMSLFQIARPFLLVGGFLTLLTTWISNSIAPQSADTFTNLKNNMGKEFSAGILRKGTFSKFNNLTIYVQDHVEGDKLHNVFIYKNEADHQISVFAQKGQLIVKDNRFYLQLFKGCRQMSAKRIEDNKSFFFEELLYDLEILQPKSAPVVSDGTSSLFQLLFPPTDLPSKDRYKMMAEGHKRIIGSYLVFFFVLHAVAILLTSPYKRGGNNRLGLFTVLLGILLQIAVYALINMLGKSYIILGLAYSLLVGLSFLYFSWLGTSQRRIPVTNEGVDVP